MQPQSRPYQSHVRSNNYHTQKRHLLGNRAGQPPPAWRPHGVPALLPGGAGGAGGGSINYAAASSSSAMAMASSSSSLVNGKAKETESKILISKLPLDVGEIEVEELFKKTVGPLKDVFLIYNSQGRSKGMAVVTFQRPGDAVIARSKYDGKIVDGRRPLKLEIIYDGMPTQFAAAAATSPLVPAQPSLLTRIAHMPIKSNNTLTNGNGVGVALAPGTSLLHSSRIGPPVSTNTTRRNAAATVVVASSVVPPRRQRQKKGPKRVKKRVADLAMSSSSSSARQRYVVAPASKEQLDKEMDDYRAEADEM
ncbi:hypothetical protein AMATHDRAFT_66366 [Amanita thiersii Skay4041]|uniref:RRM domain-containing protein n=1 Tax=Amanita thiersii Skay4041 TaxID=703135 RepID=A0A2A9NJY8_9AGAR|nr:hypothetical protein AMATHDRAFT_66366 [Amanita thiersii Skay4041]